VKTMLQSEISVRSSVDGTMQPSLFYRSPNPGRPLLVGLHTWSYDRFNQVDNMLPYAEKYDFNLLLPEFRGPNLISNPQKTFACGSKEAKNDVKDAIDYVLREYDVDAENILLLGLSGGGHMTLLMCGFCPELFKVAAAFVPITDLKKWTEENAGYREHVLACCSDSEEEMMKRSPVSYLETIAKANLKIFHGKFDHFVPKEQSINLYFKILEKYPSAKVYLDIFDGKHEMDMELAMHWFITQYEKKKIATVTG